MKIRSGPILALVLAGLAVSGCALPPILVVASNVIDGMSLIGTGKTVTDHALSAATEEDCALWRVVRGEAICTQPAGRTVMAEAPPAGDAAHAPAAAPVAAVAAVPVAAVATAEVEVAASPPPSDAGIPVPPSMRALLTVPDHVPPPRAKPVELAEVPAPPRLPEQR